MKDLIIRDDLAGLSGPIETPDDKDARIAKLEAERDALKVELNRKVEKHNVMGDVSEAIGFLETNLKDDAALAQARAELEPDAQEAKP